MTLTVSQFDPARDDAEWDELCQRAPMATLLHTRRFLSYHGDRFEDQSRLVRDAAGKLIAALPAARHAGQTGIVASHPGATFGGLIHNGDLLGKDLLHVLALIGKDFKASEFSALHYKAVPHIYHQWPSSDDLYALWRLGATVQRCDLSSTIDVSARRAPNARRRRALRKADAVNLHISNDSENLAAFWSVLIETLGSRHGVAPVHTLSEMQRLMTRFPEQMQLVTASIDGKVEAGVVLFLSARVSHAQYIASSTSGREHNALDAIFEHCIVAAQERACRYFDFGISTEDQGRTLNTGLYQYKSEFGGGGATHEHYYLALDDQFAEKCAQAGCLA
ncbi:MAG TPA: GNAT family N-acetyltransferase [Rhodocyclaceae bacterium]|nr:GNAT family N-acetyltransferase [Rhodocyclaceae bacterium]